MINSNIPPKAKKKYNYTKPAGRPSKYGNINKNQLKILVLEGFTDKRICDFFEITEATLTGWKKKYPNFFASLKDWKLQADEEIQRSLWHSAKGYKTTFKKNMVVSAGKSGSRIETVTEEIAFAPNPTSIIFWLKNRQPKQWRDKQDVEVSGSMSWEGLVNAFTGAASKDTGRVQGIPDRSPLHVL